MLNVIKEITKTLKNNLNMKNNTHKKHTHVKNLKRQ